MTLEKLKKDILAVVGRWALAILGAMVAGGFYTGSLLTKQDMRTSALEAGDARLLTEHNQDATKNQEFRERVIDALSEIKTEIKDTRPR